MLFLRNQVREGERERGRERERETYRERRRERDIKREAVKKSAYYCTHTLVFNKFAHIRTVYEAYILQKN